MPGNEYNDTNERPNTSRNQDGDQSSNPASSSPPGGGNNPVQMVLSHYQANKLDALLMLTRFSSVLFALSYLLPFGCGIACFRKAVIANAATSALRLHQRLPPFQLTREFMAQLMLEDSCHYLLFSMIFLYTLPITMVLLPLALFALLHISSNTLVIMDKTGTRTSAVGQWLSSVVERHQKSVLLMVAMSEVILMPIVVLAVFSGVCSLITPIVYYQFLCLRYSSRRNPYTRQTFRTLRLTIEQLISLPQCPSLIRSILRTGIDFTCRLAPVTAPTN